MIKFGMKLHNMTCKPYESYKSYSLLSLSSIRSYRVSLDRKADPIRAAAVNSAPPTHPTHLGCMVMIHPPSRGPMMRVMLSIEVIAPKTPPRRLGGAAWEMR